MNDHTKISKNLSDNKPVANQKLLVLMLIIGAIAAAYVGLTHIPEKQALGKTTDAFGETNAILEQKVGAVSASNNAATGSYLSAILARNIGDHENAALFIQNALKSDPKNTTLKEQLYHVLLVQGKVPEAIAIAKQISGGEPHRSMAAPVLLAIEEIKYERYTAALEMLGAKDLKGNLNALVLPLLNSWVKIGAGLVKAPLDAKSVLGGLPTQQTIFITYHLALMNEVLGYDKEAAEYYAKALADPQKTPLRMIEVAAYFYARTGRDVELKSLVESASDKSMMQLLMQTINTLPKTKMKPLVSDARQGVSELMYSLGSILYGVNAVEDEFIYLHLAQYLNPNASAAQYLLASSLEQSKSFDQAIDRFAVIDKTSPLYFRGQIRSAEIFYVMGKKKEAYQLLDDIAKIYPQMQEPQLSKGDFLREEKRFDESAKAYSVVIDALKNPQAPDWQKFYSRGIAYERAGEWDKAQADFNKALSLEPDQPDVLNYLGYSWLVMGKNINQAKQYIQRALDQRPDDVHIIDSMGWALYITGEFEAARDYLERAVELAPGDPTVIDHLGDLYFRLGRKTEAKFQWQRALVFKPDEKLKAELDDKIENGLAPFVPPQSSQTAEDNLKKVQ